MTKIFKGIRFRLTLVYSTLFGLFICAFAYIITNQYLQDGRADFDHGLFNYAIDLSEHLEIDHAGLRINFALPASEDRKSFPFILQETYYFVRSLDGKIISRGMEPSPFHQIPFDPKLPKKEDYTHRFFTFEHNDNPYRAVNLKITNVSGREMILQVATPSDALEAQERRHLLMTSLMVPILILISSLASYFIAGNALIPIRTLTDTANNIAAKNLSLRVPEVNTGDEVEDLAKTLNTLLERLEVSFKAQEHFVSNASHQLNTPLAIIKGELDVLESKPRQIEDYIRFQKSLREEIERLIELVKNMLLVSRVESGLENFIFHPLRIDDLLLTTSSRLSYKAREKRITVRFNISEEIPHESLTVMGEKQLLDSLFENILDNAIKYSPEDSTIQIDIQERDGKLEVWIQDEGPGIQEDFQTLLTKRFHRSPGISIPGTGIGLPIANRIAGYHHAIISLERPGPRGSRFIIRFN